MKMQRTQLHSHNKHISGFYVTPKWQPLSCSCYTFWLWWAISWLLWMPLCRNYRFQKAVNADSNIHITTDIPKSASYKYSFDFFFSIHESTLKSIIILLSHLMLWGPMHWGLFASSKASGYPRQLSSKGLQNLRDHGRTLSRIYSCYKITGIPQNITCCQCPPICSMTTKSSALKFILYLL